MIKSSLKMPFLAMIALAPTGLASAQTTSTFVPPDVDPPFSPAGEWSDPAHWDTPDYPDNGQPGAGDLYDVIIRTGQAQLDGDYTIRNLTLGETLDGTDEGTISQSGGVMRTLDVDGLFTFEGGRIFARTTINANGGLLITGDANKRINNASSSSASYTAYINNAATGTWDAGNVGGTLILSTTNPQVRSQLTNLASGTFNATAGGFDFAPLFNNHGVLNIDPGAGLDIEFDFLFNDGTVNILSGTASIVETVDGALAPGAGSYVVGNGALLELGGYSGAGHISGDGELRIAGVGSSYLSGPGTGSLNLNGTTRIVGYARLPENAVTEQLILDGLGASGYVGGGFTTGTGLAGDITVHGSTQWLNGGYGGTATIHADGGVTFASTDDLHVLSDEMTLNLGGDSVVNADARTIYVEDNATLNIAQGATLTFLGQSGIRASEVPGSLNNAGTIHATGGLVSIGAHSVNTGLIIAEGFGSNINFNGYDSNVPSELELGLDQQAGELRMLGASIGYIDSFTGGKLTGFGDTTQLTITAGTISPGMTDGPGDAVGMIEFDGLVLESGAVLEFDLAGTGLDEHDHLFTTFDSTFQNFGDMHLGGNLVLRFAEGFENTITETDTLTIIEAVEATTGAFANVAAGERLMTADGLGSFIVNYGSSSTFGGNAVVLSDFEPIPEPGSLALLGLGGLALLTRRRNTI